MATWQDLSLSGVTKNISEYNVFKGNFITRINWTKEKWILEKEAESKLHVIMRKCKYWFTTLANYNVKNALLFTLYKEGLDWKPNVLKVMRAFKEQCGLKGFKGIATTNNIEYLILEFTDEEHKQKALKSFKRVEEYIVIASEWFKENEHFNMEIQWFPTFVDIEEVENVIGVYLDTVWLNNEFVRVDEQDLVKTGKIIGKVKFKKGVALEKIPYFITVNGYTGHVLIRKRRPICFGCLEVGHIIAQCNLKFCRRCKKKKWKKHECTSSVKKKLQNFSREGDKRQPDLVEGKNLNTCLQNTEMESLFTNVLNVDSKIQNGKGEVRITNNEKEICCLTNNSISSEKVNKDKVLKNSEKVNLNTEVEMECKINELEMLAHKSFALLEENVNVSKQFLYASRDLEEFSSTSSENDFAWNSDMNSKTIFMEEGVSSQLGLVESKVASLPDCKMKKGKNSKKSKNKKRK